MHWNELETRFLVVFSLFLQILLIFFAPLRRRKKCKWVSPMIWAAYLLADWIAAYALRILPQITHGIPECNDSHSTNCSRDNELFAFWAPFLLMHIGGPDTITALALEDNELWLRHFLTLAIHLFGTVYVFVFALRINRLFIPTLTIFIVGILRYMERSYALYLASSGGFEGGNLKDSLTLKGTAKEPERATGGLLPRGISGIETVQSAHRFLATYKDLVVDHLLSIQEGMESRSYFQELQHNEAFGIIEVELGLLYDRLYTKAIVIHTSTGYILRAVSFFSILFVLVIFYAFDKHGYHPTNKFITYTLLVGAIVLDLVAIVNLIFSDWMVASLRNPMARRLYSKMFACICPYGTPRHTAYMSQYNLISYCQRHCWKSRKMAALRRIDDFIEQLIYTKDVPVSDDIRMFMFNDLLTKSKQTNRSDFIKNTSTSKWEWPNNVPNWFFEFELEELVLLWHIATDLCYHLREDESTADREFSKQVSEYMHYLLVVHPTMISSKEGNAQIKWQAVCQETMKFIRNRNLKVKKDICQKLLDEIKFCSTTQRTGSLLRDACLVVKQLELLRQQVPNTPWATIRKVWVELLSSAANNCSGRYHVQRLAKGGEFITDVWLLMAHFGLAEKYWGELNFPKVDSYAYDDLPRRDGNASGQGSVGPTVM
ncbi:uncharacterized protein LOC131257809 [Magnolia sinica]|uniref:uncharacterized protein LOC131257809 n=1 Tax=Magnolia sinica TaxID=86752 RepID=UPI0026585907|nr:uncharacterized protein LOC131257809 [Magnolia sinica]